MSDQSYYIALGVVDRISELAKEKFSTFGHFSVIMGWKASQWQSVVDKAYGIRFNTLVRIAKVLNLSVEYLLTGKNKQPYTDDNISIDNLGKIKIHGSPKTIYSTQVYIRKGKQKNIGLKVLFDIEAASGVSVMNLLRGKIQ